MTDDFRAFALSTAQSVAREEGNKMAPEMEQDLQTLMLDWADRLADRIQARMDVLGIPQNLQVRVEWAPIAPQFNIIGETYVGGMHDHESE